MSPPTGFGGDPVLHLEGVSKTYRDGSSEIRALREIDLDLGRGEMVSLAGVSGSGKTTLLGVIAGLVLPESGHVRFNAVDLISLSDTERARVRNTGIGIVLQRGNLIPFLTVRENVELVTGLDPDGGSAAEAVDLLHHLGLENRLDHRPRQLSGGEAQRAAVAVALANKPALVLADEATAELDGETADQVMELLFDQWRRHQLTVLYVTHDAELAARAERQLKIVDGRLVPS